MLREMPRLEVRTQADLLRLAISGGRPARIAMHGRSMLPLLHEPMVLEVRALCGAPRIGELIVFRGADRLVAHRVIGRRRACMRCAGDAQPSRVEVVEADDVVGVVNAVWSSDRDQARRVDGPAFRLAGWLYARTRSVRALANIALPWRRTRPFAQLYMLLRAVARGESLEQLLRSVDPVELAHVAERHRCAALLHEAIEGIPDEPSRELGSLLQRARWSTTLRSAKLRGQLQDVVALLNRCGIEPILLKGAARLWSCGAQARLHDSSDLDLLVDEKQLDGARAALLAAGYRDDVRHALRLYYDRVHHHIAPLYPIRGVSVELHRSLARRGQLSLDTSSGALARHTVRAEIGGVRAYALDRVGAALHLAVHGYVRPLLRDVFLLAKQIAEMTASQRDELRALLETERIEPVRLQAVVYLAAAMAGVAWPSSGSVRRFARWTLERNDLPRALRARPECIDAWFGARRRRVLAVSRAAFAMRPLDRSPRRYVRPFARLLAGGVTACWLLAVKRQQQPQALEIF